NTDLAPRQEIAFDCPKGHHFTVPFAAEAEVPATWECRVCGTIAFTATGDQPSPKKSKPPRSHWDMLRERRSIDDLEQVLAGGPGRRGGGGGGEGGRHGKRGGGGAAKGPRGPPRAPGPRGGGDPPAGAPPGPLEDDLPAHLAGPPLAPLEGDRALGARHPRR